ncbi:MAG: hypothetical protein P4L76_04665 [Beijerinckiaceae bacterium]|nr:hypothetical protein [Beijerinckiaceae bacterium]
MDWFSWLFAALWASSSAAKREKALRDRVLFLEAKYGEPAVPVPETWAQRLVRRMRVREKTLKNSDSAVRKPSRAERKAVEREAKIAARNERLRIRREKIAEAGRQIARAVALAFGGIIAAALIIGVLYAIGTAQLAARSPSSITLHYR